MRRVAFDWSTDLRMYTVHTAKVNEGREMWKLGTWNVREIQRNYIELVDEFESIEILAVN